MPDYHFYKKGEHVVALQRSDAKEAILLHERGYEKQFEEINAVTEGEALTRLYDIRRNNRIDHRNFLAGAGTMPLIGIFTALVIFLFRKRKP